MLVIVFRATKAFIDMVVTDTDGMAAEFGFTPPSATLKALSRNAADAIVYPTTMQSFVVETSTNVIGGMATNVCLARMVTHKSPTLKPKQLYWALGCESRDSVQDQFQASRLRPSVLFPSVMHAAIGHSRCDPRRFQD